MLTIFVPQSGVEKIIVNMVDNDHGMQDTIVRVTSPGDGSGGSRIGE